MEQEAQIPMNFSLNDARDINCECGSGVIMTGMKIKKVSRLITGGAKDSIIPIEVFLCTQCGKTLQELLPEELREKQSISE